MRRPFCYERTCHPEALPCHGSSSIRWSNPKASNWHELCMAESLAYFKGDMVLYSPESYTAEEMWQVVMEMFEVTIAVQEAMHEDFISHAPKERQALLDACVGSNTASEE